LLRALRQRTQREIKQPEHIAWHALEARTEDSDGSMRQGTGRVGIMDKEILRWLTWQNTCRGLLPIMMLERLRRGLSLVEIWASASGRKA
jgi:hypothetical protein